MGERTGIQWTNHTFNPWIGCAEVSPACDHCYARTGSARFEATLRNADKMPRHLRLWGEGAEGHRHVTSDSYWRQPLAWNRKAARDGVRRRVFCASFADVLEDRRDLDPLRARLWNLIELTPHLDWLLLTKRIDRAAAFAAQAAEDCGIDGLVWLPNIWIGTTVEDQRRADERIPHLLTIPASVRFLSVEPQLAHVDLSFIVAEARNIHGIEGPHEIGWVICGGESGSHARPFDLAWARSLRDQCRAAGVPFFMKQLGARPVASVSESTRGMGGVGLSLRDSHGGNPDEWPEDLRVREVPS
jgi:protein gp37